MVCNYEPFKSATMCYSFSFVATPLLNGFAYNHKMQKCLSSNELGCISEDYSYIMSSYQRNKTKCLEHHGEPTQKK